MPLLQRPFSVVVVVLDDVVVEVDVLDVVVVTHVAAWVGRTILKSVVPRFEIEPSPIVNAML